MILVRELASLLKRYVIVGLEDALVSALGSKNRERSVRVELARITADRSISLKHLTGVIRRHFEYYTIKTVLEAHSWNKKATARALNISYTALMYKLEQSRTEKALSPGFQENLVELAGELLAVEDLKNRCSSAADSRPLGLVYKLARLLLKFCDARHPLHQPIQFLAKPLSSALERKYCLRLQRRWLVPRHCCCCRSSHC